MTATAVSSLESAASARLLALAFVPPDAEHLERLGALAEALAAGTEAERARAVADAVASVTVEDLAFEHERLFGIEGACVPYEGAWERDPFREWRSLADIAGFYAACGTETGGPLAERADHAGCELEYLAFLLLRAEEAEAAGEAEEAASCEGTADAFLREHLGRFLGTLLAEVRACTGSPLYAALADFGEEWIERELRLRGLTTIPVVARRGRLGVEQDELTCGSGCPQLVQLERRRSGAGPQSSVSDRRSRET